MDRWDRPTAHEQSHFAFRCPIKSRARPDRFSRPRKIDFSMQRAHWATLPPLQQGLKHIEIRRCSLWHFGERLSARYKRHGNLNLFRKSEEDIPYYWEGLNLPIAIFLWRAWECEGLDSIACAAKRDRTFRCSSAYRRRGHIRPKNRQWPKETRWIGVFDFWASLE